MTAPATAVARQAPRSIASISVRENLPRRYHRAMRACHQGNMAIRVFPHWNPHARHVPSSFSQTLGNVCSILKRVPKGPFMKRAEIFASAGMAVCVAFAAIASAAPAGWQTFTDRRATCQASVPSDWKPGEYNIGMQATHGNGSVIISTSQGGDVAMAKQIAASTFTVTKVIEDTKSRYWVQYKGNGRTALANDYYVALQQPGLVCAMQLSWNSGLSDDDAKAIVASLRRR
jgi:hypothetical protein